MDSNSHPSGGSPPKPWERAGNSSSTPAPFKPSTPGNTSDVVEASGTANPGEIVPASDPQNRNSLGRPVPSRPWEQNSYGGTYGGYGSSNYNNGFGSGLYGSSYGGGYGSGMYGSSYGGGLYGNSMYRGGYGGMYGGGMYNNGFGGSMGGYGMGMGSGPGPFGDQDPNNPFGAPPSPPGFWISFLRVLHGVVNFFGRISVLIDQNTQAFHMFMSALLQLFDRSGMLYGELARFVLRILGVKTKSLKKPQEKLVDNPKPPGGGPWDGVWQG